MEGGNAGQRQERDPSADIDWTKVPVYNAEQRALHNIFSQFDTYNPNTSGEEARKILQDEMSIFQYTRVEILSNPSFYKATRIFLERRDIPVPPFAFGKNLLMIRTAAAIWKEDEHEPALQEAMERYHAYREGHVANPENYQNSDLSPRALQTPRRLRESADPPNPDGAQGARRRLNIPESSSSQPSLFSKIQACYKGEKQKFGGTFDENWTIELARYERLCTQFELSREQKVQFIHVMFKDDAEHFYFDELRDITQWGELVIMLNKRYNSEARKRSILDELRSITIHDYISNESDESQALQSVARRIEKLVPQCPPGRNTDRDKLDHLYHAVRMMDWAQPTVTALTNTDKTYKTFLDELTTAEQSNRIKLTLQNKVPKLKSRRNGEGSASSAKPSLSRLGTGNDAAIWFQGQARYGRDPRAPKRKSLAKKGDNRCYNCDSTNHLLPECKKPRDDVRIMTSRIRDQMRGKSPSHKVKILKKLLNEQSEHINFLSEQLLDQLQDKISEDISGSESSDGSNASPDSSHRSDQESSSEDQSPVPDPQDVMYAISGSVQPHQNAFTEDGSGDEETDYGTSEDNGERSFSIAHRVPLPPPRATPGMPPFIPSDEDDEATVITTSPKSVLPPPSISQPSLSNVLDQPYGFAEQEYHPDADYHSDSTLNSFDQLVITSGMHTGYTDIDSDF